MDHMTFIPTSETSKSESAEIKMDLTYDSFVKEEIIDIDDVEEELNDGDDEDNHAIEEEPTIIQQPQLLKTQPRPVILSPKQSQGPIAISKHLTKPVFIPINLSNVKTIKVRMIFFFCNLNFNT